MYMYICNDFILAALLNVDHIYLVEVKHFIPLLIITIISFLYFVM